MRAISPAESSSISCSHHAVGRWGPKHGLLQLLRAFRAQKLLLRASVAVFGSKRLEFGSIGQDCLERKLLPGSELAAATAHQAAAARDFVQPHRECLGAFELAQLPGGAQQRFLHGVLGVLGVFAVAADLHAEREDGVLQDGQGGVHRLRTATVQEGDGVLDLRAHFPPTMPQPRVGIHLVSPRFG